MYKYMLTILAALCASTVVAQPAPCNGHTPQPVNIFYGDSRIQAYPAKIHTHKSADFLRFQLNTAHKNNNLLVTIHGESSDTGADPNWINISGTGADQRLDVCLDDADANYVTYKYSVKIENVGDLDPMVVVEP